MLSSRRWLRWMGDRVSPVPGSGPSYHVVGQSEEDDGPGSAPRVPSPSLPLALDSVSSHAPAALDRTTGRALTLCAISFAAFMAIVLLTGR